MLGFIREAGIEPTIIEYLKTPPTRAELTDLIARMAIPVRALLSVSLKEVLPHFV